MQTNIYLTQALCRIAIVSMWQDSYCLACDRNCSPKSEVQIRGAWQKLYQIQCIHKLVRNLFLYPTHQGAFTFSIAGLIMSLCNGISILNMNGCYKNDTNHIRNFVPIPCSVQLMSQFLFFYPIYLGTYNFSIEV